jgi:hypothetical protein
MYTLASMAAKDPASLIAGAIANVLSGQDIKGLNIPADVCSGEPSTALSVAKIEANIQKDEEVLFFYLNNAQNKIILTSKRFLKVENSKVVSETTLNRIKSVRQLSGGIFAWDKVETTEVDNRVETFGIYKGDVAKFFTKILQIHLNKLHG